MEHSDRDDSLGFDQTLLPTSPTPSQKESPQKPSGGAPPLDRTLGNLNTLGGLPGTPEPPMSDLQATAFFNAPAGLSEGLSLGGNYRLDRRLGRGGMGEAWRASDLMAGRDVVIKLVPPEVRNAEFAMGQVRDTFSKVHALQHQHICPIMGLIEDPNFGVYLVMKFISGKTLDVYRRDYIAEHGRFPASEAIQLLWAVARALDYSHDRKVLHRDVKPQNIMISPQDGVQLIDFGLAAEIRSTMMQVSETPMDMAGTRPYMAPEQWRGRLQDAKTDQYALAVTAYELIAGHLPFQSQDVTVLRECALNEEPEPIAGVAEHINAAIRKAMSKRREDRYENCRAFVKAMATKPKEAEKASATTPPPALQTTQPEAIDPMLAAAMAFPSVKVVETKTRPYPTKAGAFSIDLFSPQNLSFFWMALGSLGAILLFLLVWWLFGSSKPAASRPDTPAAAASNTVSNKKDKPAANAKAAAASEFRSIFDGKTISDFWRNPSGSWRVENGNLVCRDKGNLLSSKEYENFEMRFEFRLSSGTNNGFHVRTPFDGKTYDFDGSGNNGGFEIQIADESAYQQWPADEKHGSIWRVEAAKQGALKPVGQWNRQEIYVNGKDVRVTLNGEVILSTNIQKHSARINKPKGYLGFKHNSGTIDLRNIEFRELPSTSTTVASAAAPVSTVAPDDGFVSLFNGRSFGGHWRIYNETWRSTSDVWSVENNRIVCKGGGYLLSTKEYENFVLRFDFRISQGTNNGVLVRVPEDGNQTNGGFEIQILDDFSVENRSPTAKNLHGSIWNVEAAKQGALKPPGQWNSQEIYVNGKDVRVTLNGEVILSTNIHQYNTQVNKPKGYIGFAHMKGEIELRNIEIKELSGGSSVSTATAPTVAASVDDGFVSLFNGRDLTGWIPKGGQNMFRVEDGCILGVAGSQYSVLCTAKEYENFIFKLDFKFEKPCNSGIQFRSKTKSGGGRDAVFGYQYDLDGQKMLSGMLWGEGMGRQWLGGAGPDNTAMTDKVRGAYKPNEWNEAVIECTGSSIKTRLNGKPIQELIDTELEKGIFGLQMFGSGEGTVMVRWRNIRVKELPGASSASSGVISLFDGKSFAGWTGDTQAWRAANGVLYHEDRGTIYTRDEYDDFDLTFDFYIDKGGNNGLLLRAKEGVPAMEIQIADWTSPTGQSVTGGLHGYLDASSNQVKAGQWNTMAVRYVGTKITVKVNHVTVVDTDLKSANKPGFRNTKGRIGFMGYNGKSSYRNIEIRPTGKQNDVSARSPPLGPEMLKVTTFKDGYKPSYKWKPPEQNFDWIWQDSHEGKRSPSTLSNTPEGLKMACLSRDAKVPLYLPHLVYSPVSMIKGKQYRVEMELRSETANKAIIRVDAWMPKWHDFGSKRLHLEKDWNTYQLQFTANETCDKAVLNLHNFEVGGIYEIRRASLREVLPESSSSNISPSVITNDKEWLDKFLAANPGLTESVATWENGRIVKLDVTEKGLTGTLDVSPLTELKALLGNKNRFTALDLSKNTKLKRLFFDGNQLAVLDVNRNVELNEIGCAGNQLTALDVSQNTKLHSLWCQGNRLTALVVPKNLMGLECARNKLTALDLSNNTNLEWLSCYGNPLATLDVSKNGKLKNLGCQDCSLKELDIDGCKKLEFLYCERNQLTKLDVSGCSALLGFNCHNNRLTTLDLTGTPYADLTSFIRTSHGNRYTYKDKEKDRPSMMVDQNVTLLPTQTEKK